MIFLQGRMSKMFYLVKRSLWEYFMCNLSQQHQRDGVKVLWPANIWATLKTFNELSGLGKIYFFGWGFAENIYINHAKRESSTLTSATHSTFHYIKLKKDWVFMKMSKADKLTTSTKKNERKASLLHLQASISPHTKFIFFLWSRNFIFHETAACLLTKKFHMSQI